MSKHLNNNIAVRTCRELVSELIDAMVSNPAFADQPIGFTTCANQSTVYYVRGMEEDDDTGNSIVLTRG